MRRRRLRRVQARATYAYGSSAIHTFGCQAAQMRSLAAALTAEPSFLAGHDLDPAWLDCVVLLDSEGYEVSTMAAANELYRNAFGDDPAVWVDASPSEHVGEGPLPAEILIVTRGRAERVGKGAVVRRPTHRGRCRCASRRRQPALACRCQQLHRRRRQRDVGADDRGARHVRSAVSASTYLCRAHAKGATRCRVGFHRAMGTVASS